MPAPDRASVLKVLREAADFTRLMGSTREAQALEEFHTQFQTEKPTLKLLRGPVQKAKDEASISMHDRLMDGLRRPLPGMEARHEEFGRIWRAFANVIYPPKFIEHEMSVDGFAGVESVGHKKVSYLGSPAEVRAIFERSVAFIKTYTGLVGAHELEKAWALASPEFQESMPFKKYTGEHERAAARFGGHPSEYEIDRFGWIFPDEEARNNFEIGTIWPGYVPRTVRRATVHGFWICNTAARTGCRGSLWLVEQGGEYRVAKFDFNDE